MAKAKKTKKVEKTIGAESSLQQVVAQIEKRGRYARVD